jgi:AraC-like DNA-binding protein
LAAVNTHVDLENVYPEGVNKLYRELLQVNEHSRIRRYLKGQLIDPIIIERKKLLEDNSYMILDKIEKKIAESKGNISVTECADALGVSTTYIWKVLKMESGKSFSDYQDEYKLEEAKRLLLETDMSVVDIAAKLNYTNAQNFIRFFSKKTGITPGKFRKL